MLCVIIGPLSQADRHTSISAATRNFTIKDGGLSWDSTPRERTYKRCLQYSSNSGGGNGNSVLHIFAGALPVCGGCPDTS